MNKNLYIYYHMPYMVGSRGELYSNSVMGNFAESLSPYFKKIILIGFIVQNESEEINYKINASNIVFNNLGLRGQFWDYFRKIKNIKNNLKKLKNNTNDLFLLRAPSPLAYVIWKYSGKPTNTILLIVGNPHNNAHFYNNFSQFIFRKIRSEIQKYRLRYICQNSKILILVNSLSLKKIWGKILGSYPQIINTSSISKRDICKYENAKTKIELPCNLLFVGRVCFDKGIRELLKAIKILNENKQKTYLLKLVGPVDDLNGYTIEDLIHHNKVEKFVEYHGSIQFGPKLFEYYKKSHAYILPSYHEGTPKTIWESMANGTPVIASKIDGIKDNFIDAEDLIFIKPKSVSSIVSAVQKITDSNILFSKLVKNGLAKSKNFTREVQANQIIEKINQNYNL